MEPIKPELPKLNTHFVRAFAPVLACAFLAACGGRDGQVNHSAYQVLNSSNTEYLNILRAETNDGDFPIPLEHVLDLLKTGYVDIDVLTIGDLGGRTMVLTNTSPRLCIEEGFQDQLGVSMSPHAYIEPLNPIIESYVKRGVLDPETLSKGGYKMLRVYVPQKRVLDQVTEYKDGESIDWVVYEALLKEPSGADTLPNYPDTKDPVVVEEYLSSLFNTENSVTNQSFSYVYSPRRDYTMLESCN